MLFTSLIFIFGFLPIAFLGFFVVARWSHRAAAIWLFVASLIFYGYWAPQFVLLLLASITVNFQLGKHIAIFRDMHAQKNARTWMVIGITANLCALAYFKYANFFIDNFNALLGSGIDIGHIVLPIGISFFTFTQIAFLVDTYQKGIRDYHFARYGLFVTYFPHLVAGPILHHAQMMPQFGNSETYRMRFGWIVAGTVLFAIGLAKKVLLADGISPYSDAVFDAVANGGTPSFLESWLAALAYTFQLYFDFSGYSDMAVGLSWLFGIRLPYNFNSPYKAANISEFWRCWHMSLSAFLRDYLYIPLGGNRKGRFRQYVNLMVTMLLGGLWHGANWTFLFWGGLHGLYLAVSHGFRALIMDRLPCRLANSLLYRFSGRTLTFAVVVIAWVFFRAANISSAFAMLHAMAMPAPTDVNPLLWNVGLHAGTGLWFCLALGAVVFLMPNSNKIGERILARMESNYKLAWIALGAMLTLIFVLAIINATRDSVSAFIYFNF